MTSNFSQKLMPTEEIKNFLHFDNSFRSMTLSQIFSKFGKFPWLKAFTVEYIMTTFRTTKTWSLLDRWSLYRDTVSNDHLIKWSLCTGFLKKSACQI